MTTASDKTLDRIRRLLAQAESTTHEGERETFMEKAAYFMAKYGIERAQLGHLHPDSDKPNRRIISAYNPWANEQIRLIYRVAEALRCQCLVLGSGRSGRPSQVEVFGFSSDMERAELLYTSLLLQMFTGLHRQPIPAGHRRPRAFRHAWLVGFADEAARRIAEAEQRARHEAELTSTSTTIALLDRDKIVSRMFSDAYPKFRDIKSPVDAAGLLSGIEAGARADIGGTRLGTAPRAALR
ncbi:DUF2786 domain-containing protein [Nonomuraea sp. NPDC050394]|uniref:DUF2786 domain-containing protein n=1 Tax=Nonomuraea sp. NPDC050394 TaxID=3364363 RepID=UPI0037B25F39